MNAISSNKGGQQQQQQLERVSHYKRRSVTLIYAIICLCTPTSWHPQLRVVRLAYISIDLLIIRIWSSISEAILFLFVRGGHEGATSVSNVRTSRPHKLDSEKVTGRLFIVFVSVWCTAIVVRTKVEKKINKWNPLKPVNPAKLMSFDIGKFRVYITESFHHQTRRSSIGVRWWTVFLRGFTVAHPLKQQKSVLIFSLSYRGLIFL